MSSLFGVHSITRPEVVAALVGGVAAGWKRVAVGSDGAERWRRLLAVPWCCKSSISQSMLLLLLLFEGEGEGGASLMRTRDICRRAMRRMEV